MIDLPDPWPMIERVPPWLGSFGALGNVYVWAPRSIVLLPPGIARTVFLLAGLGVEALGMGLVVRVHIPVFEEKR